jgi:hypothetical protein
MTVPSGKIDKRFDDIRVLLIERLLATGEQPNFVIGFDRDGAIAVELDLFCGVRRYAALGMRLWLGRHTNGRPTPHNSCGLSRPVAKWR